MILVERIQRFLSEDQLDQANQDLLFILKKNLNRKLVVISGSRTW